MATTTDKLTSSIVPRRGQALAMRTAALVRRGIRDFGREPNWVVKRVFSGRQACTAVSPGGKIAVFLGAGSASGLRLAICDLDLDVPTESLPTPEFTEEKTPKGRSGSALVWSSSGRILLAASNLSSNQLQIFDAQSKTHLESFAVPDLPNASFAWSPDGSLLGAAFAPDRSLRIWNCRAELPALDETPISSLDIAPSLAAVSIRDTTEDEVAFSGFGPMAFHPRGEAIALALKCAGEWADDFLLVASMPSMRRELLVPVHGGITALAFTNDGETLIYCAGGRAFAIRNGELESTPLFFNAELARCHPTQPLCACYSSWLKNSSKGRIFVADLSTGVILDGYDAESVVDICWSYDTQQVYGVTHDGMAYVYEKTLG
jgi:WD40 repeat protein